MRDLRFRFYDHKLTKSMVYQEPYEAKNVIFDKWETTPKCSPLMQYTGLKDKNGVEIYEGDIVEYCECVDENTVDGPFMGTEVVFDDCMFCLKHDAPNPLSSYVELKVIGNKYEQK